MLCVVYFIDFGRLAILRCACPLLRPGIGPVGTFTGTIVCNIDTVWFWFHLVFRFVAEDKANRWAYWKILFATLQHTRQPVRLRSCCRRP